MSVLEFDARFVTVHWNYHLQVLNLMWNDPSVDSDRF